LDRVGDLDRILEKGLMIQHLIQSMTKVLNYPTMRRNPLTAGSLMCRDGGWHIWRVTNYGMNWHKPFSFCHGAYEYNRLWRYEKRLILRVPGLFSIRNIGLGLALGGRWEDGTVCILYR